MPGFWIQQVECVVEAGDATRNRAASREGALPNSILCVKLSTSMSRKRVRCDNHKLPSDSWETIYFRMKVRFGFGKLNVAMPAQRDNQSSC